MKVEVKDSVIVMINREHEGGQIDQKLLKKVLGFFVDIGMKAY